MFGCVKALHSTPPPPRPPPSPPYDSHRYGATCCPRARAISAAAPRASPVKDKHLYTNLVRAQLSSYEIALTFYNCLSEMGREKFKPLVERYALLKTRSVVLRRARRRSETS